VHITDTQDNAKIRENIVKFKNGDIKFELGGHSKNFLKNSSYVVTSPGIDNKAQVLCWARELGIPVISEIELGFFYCPAKIIAITGTSGKTTVTYLASLIFKKAGFNSFALGNIGDPFSENISKMKDSDFVCLEVSSFQLENIESFKPKVSVILNIGANHLDRHADFNEYFAAKKRIFLNQDSSDYLLINYQDKLLRGLEKETKAKVIFFNKEKGRFNLNQSAVLAIASVFGISEKFCLEVFSEFKGLPHRQEWVRSLRGVDFVNDSKATTIEATIWAFENINKPIVLIAGGKDKGVQYEMLNPYLEKKGKAVVLIGQAKDKIKNALKADIPFKEELSLEGAVKTAYNLAKEGDCVLLSPMCSSYDMFKDYEERGKLFKEAVIKLDA
jgi:UDP-N-acetylmuramoylalanine--D-glutamate ligase